MAVPHRARQPGLWLPHRKPVGPVELDRSNRFAQGLDLAVLLRGGLAGDLARGQKGTAFGTPTPVIHATLGPSLSFDGSGDSVEFSGRSTSTGLDITLGVACHFIGAGSDARAIHTSSTLNRGYGLDFRDSPLQVIQFVLGGVDFSTNTVPIIDGAPVFALASYRRSDGATNLLTRRLDNGAVAMSSGTTSGTPLAGDGNWSIGGSRVFSSNMFPGTIAAGFIATRYMSLSELQAWAERPYQVFRPVARRTIYLPATSAGETVVGAGGSLHPIGIGAVGLARGLSAIEYGSPT